MCQIKPRLACAVPFAMKNSLPGRDFWPTLLLSFPSRDAWLNQRGARQASERSGGVWARLREIEIAGERSKGLGIICRATATTGRELVQEARPRILKPVCLFGFSFGIFPLHLATLHLRFKLTHSFTAGLVSGHVSIPCGRC